MSRNVNVIIGGWRAGTSVSFQRRLVEVTVSYTDDAGALQTKTGTITFPDILSSLTPEDLKELGMEIMLRAYRRTQGID